MVGAVTAGLAVIFLLRLVIYSTGYTQVQIGGAAVSKRLRLLLGDKLKKIPLARFTQGQVGQYVNTCLLYTSRNTRRQWSLSLMT